MRLSFNTIFVVLCSTALLQVTPCFAQHGKKKPTPPAVKVKDTPAVATPPKAEEPATTKPIVIYETVPARERPKAVEIRQDELMRSKEKDVVVKHGKKEIPKGDFAIVYDTAKPVAAPPATAPITTYKDTAIVVRKARKTPDTEDTLVIKDDNSIVKNPKGKSKEVAVDVQYCACVELVVKAQDTISFENYVNYSFSFKNKCRDNVFINSGSFSFMVMNSFGGRITELRKMDYAKRFEFPDFVKVAPGEQFEFRLADDPFFQFEMSKNTNYRFRFMYNNTSNKYRAAPAKTYLCIKMAEKEIYVK